MTSILVVEVTNEMRETFVKGLPPGSTIHYDTGNPNDQTCWFDENSSSWNKPEFEEYNWLFLRQQQNWANDMLRARGHVFLNEIYGMLGLPHTTSGALLGWIYNEDSYINFGCFDGPSAPGQLSKPLKQEREDAIWLKFNVDGPIVQLLHR